MNSISFEISIDDISPFASCDMQCEIAYEVHPKTGDLEAWYVASVEEAVFYLNGHGLRVCVEDLTEHNDDLVRLAERFANSLATRERIDAACRADWEGVCETADIEAAERRSLPL